MMLFHNRGVFQRFVDELRHTYGDVDAPQRGVGAGLLVAQAEHLGRPVDPRRQLAAAVRPRLADVPGQLTTEFIAWQADIVREYARDDQFVTTYIAYERPTVDDATSPGHST